VGPRSVLAVLVTAQVVSVANQNLIAVALPALSRDLGASPVQELWIVDAYVLVVAALLVAGGVLGDRFGRRRALVAGLALFAAGSLVSALAADPGVLIAGRVLQGLGPPLILPASLALVTAAYEHPRERARAIGIWGGGSGLGVAIGPLLGGVIVSGLGWRWAFAINVPVAAALVAGALATIPRDAPAGERARFDVLGGLLATGAMGALVFGLIEGPERGWSSPEVLGALAAAVALAAAFVRVERRAAAPLVDLELVRHRAFMVANFAAFALMFVLLPVSVYVSAFLQTFRDLSALQAGLALLPVGLGVVIAAPISGRLTARVAPRTLIVVGVLAAAAGTALLGTAGAGATAGDLVPALALVGLGAGIALPPSTATAVGAVPLDRTGMASALHNAGRQVGATLGVAVLGSIVVAHAADGGAGAYRDGLATAMLVAAPVLVVVAALVVTTRRPAAP
jgi:DHA2 family methylenomycin A resistance protein-like MFS transporter